MRALLLAFLLFSPLLLLTAPRSARAGEPDDGAAFADVLEMEQRLFAPVEDAPLEPLVIVEHPAVVEVDQPQAGHPPGTHYLLELNVGATLGGEPAEAGAALFGFGGKPVGFPWRFYFLVEAAQTHARDAGLVPSGAYVADRRFWALGAGLRIYVPLWDPVRIFGDALLGGAHVTSSLLREELGPLETADWYLSGAVAAGIQVRILHELSIGVRAKLVLADDGLSDLRHTLQIGGGFPAVVMAGLTWHI